jgi:endonuclease-3
MKSADVNAIFSVLQKLNPNPKTELNYLNHYTLLVAIVLSAQATDASVNKATASLFPKVDTAEKMVKLGEEGLKKYIKTIGLYNAKAKNVIALSKQLISEFNGQIPHDKNALQTLPGVGRKTANVWLNCALGEHTIGVDTHVFRVAARIGLAKGAITPLATEEQLERIIPSKYKQHAHHWLILHGRYICKARKPECPNCVIRKWCEYKDKTIAFSI